MFGNRGIYYKGWSAVTKRRTPWVMLDLEDDTHDHLVDPDHVMRVAMSLQ